MSEITTDLKALRLHGMADAWTDWVAQGASSTASSRWLIEHLLQAETTDRAMRSVSHQMHAAKFPVHRDLAGYGQDALGHGYGPRPAPCGGRHYLAGQAGTLLFDGRFG